MAKIREQPKNPFIWGAILLAIILHLIFWFGPGMIQRYKQKKEMEMIFYGGNKSSAENSIEQYNEKIDEIEAIIDSALNANTDIYIYTNDTSINEGTFYPDLNYDVFNDYGRIRPLIQKSKDVIEAVDYFIDNKDSLGFNVKLESKNSKFKMMNINNLDEKLEFKVFSSYYYSNDQIEHLKEYAENNRVTSSPAYRNLIESKEEQIQNLYKQQSSILVFTESELNRQKIDSGMKALLAPRINLKDSTQYFYFSSYNKRIDKEQFKKKVKAFNKMFLAYQDTSNCYIRTIKLHKAKTVK